MLITMIPIVHRPKKSSQMVLDLLVEMVLLNFLSCARIVGERM